MIVVDACTKYQNVQIIRGPGSRLAKNETIRQNQIPRRKWCFHGVGQETASTNKNS